MFHFLVRCTLPLAYWEPSSCMQVNVSKLKHVNIAKGASLSSHLANAATNLKRHNFTWDWSAFEPNELLKLQNLITETCSNWGEFTEREITCQMIVLNRRIVDCFKSWSVLLAPAVGAAWSPDSCLLLLWKLTYQQMLLIGRQHYLADYKCVPGACMACVTTVNSVHNE